MKEWYNPTIEELSVLETKNGTIAGEENQGFSKKMANNPDKFPGGDASQNP